jgi:hypothetical protein
MTRRIRKIGRGWPLLLALVLGTIAAPKAQAGHGGERIVFASDRADGQRELYVVNGDGTGERRLTFNAIVERAPVWSPNGDRIAFAGLANGNWDIYTVGPDGGDLTRLTTDVARDDYPQWAADGRLVFQRGPFSCPCEAWIVNADGTEERRLPLHGNVLTPAPAPHGLGLAYATDVDGSWSLHISDLDGRHDHAITTGPSAFGDFNPRWSPAGNQIAFLRDHTGIDNDLFVVRASGTGLRQLTDTPTRAEYWPSWAGSGDLLFSATDGGPSRLHTISLVNGAESDVSTIPSAPLVEDFSDGVRDGSLWHVIADPGSTIAEQNGRLEIGIAAGSTPGGPYDQINAHFGSQCSLPSDYEFQTDYQLIEWAPIGFYASLDAFFANAGVSRQAGPWGQQYVGWSGGNGNGIPSMDTSGTFRLVRSAGLLSAFVRPSGSDAWTLVFSGPAVSGDAVYGMGLTAPGAWYTGLAASVAFDDFHLVSGELKCPDWWSDIAADAH